MTFVSSSGWLMGTCVPVGGHWAARQTQDNCGETINDDNVLTVDELRERAHIEESDTLLKSYISAARLQVERDTGCALPQQTVAVVYERVDSGIYLVPMPPTQNILTVQYMDSDGLVTSLVVDDVVQYLDAVSMPARLVWTPTAFQGLNPSMPGAALLLTVTAGWTKETLPPLLKFAVGLLASHYLTVGRDLVSVDSTPVAMPMGYEAAIAPYRLELVA